MMRVVGFVGMNGWLVVVMRVVSFVGMHRSSVWLCERVVCTSGAIIKRKRKRKRRSIAWK